MTTYYITISLIVVLFGMARLRDYERNDTELSWETVEHSQSAATLFFLGAFVLVFVSGFRYFVGADFGAYYRNGAKYAASFWKDLKSLSEPGIDLLYLIIRIFTKSRIVPIVVFSAIIVGWSMKIIYRNTDCLFMAPLLFVFLGCWHASFNAVRQCLAVVIVFSGLQDLKNKQFGKYAFRVLLAFLFHRSAIIMILPYFFANNKVTIANIVTLMLCSVVALYSVNVLMEITGFILESEYSETNEYIWRAVNPFRIAVAIVPLLFFLVVYSKKPISKEVAFNVNLCVVHAVLMIMSARSTYLARICLYTSPFVAIAIPELLKGADLRNKLLLRFTILLLYGIYFFYEVSHSDSLNHFWWVFNYAFGK